MNFFKALMSINTLQSQINRLEHSNVELATHNLQLKSQVESMKDQFLNQDHALRIATTEVNRLRGSLAKNVQKQKEVNQGQQSIQSMNAPKPNNNQKRRSRKPNKPNTVPNA